MADSTRILSTKKLTPSQRESLLNARFALVELPFIDISPVAFEVPARIERVIITSQNAVASLKGKNIQIGQCFCVGEKTAAALTEAGYPPVLCADSGEELARLLVERYNGEAFCYLGTRSRREELPSILKAGHTPLTEIEVYKTVKKPLKVPGTFDGILFFSPSAVEAFHEQNTTEGAVCFCIGPTTAGALEGRSPKAIIPSRPTAEHLILEVKKYFSKQRNTV